jgi:chromosome segregation ATPase
MKKPGGRDSREEIQNELETESAENFRVDRVYSARPSTSPVSQATAALMSSARTKRPSGSVSADTSSELALRRDLSRLQRQLADAQRELANKDDELAAEVEKRAEIAEAHDMLAEELAMQKAMLDELHAYRARTTGVEERLQETIATADELAHLLELERGERSAAATRAADFAAQLDEGRAKWAGERARLDEAHATELAQAEAAKRAGIDAAEQAAAATTERMRAGHDEELGQLKTNHERSMAALRGDLEPKALAARTLAEERERLAGELVALQAESSREAAERGEAHRRELAQLAEARTAESSAAAAKLAAETGKLASDLEAKSAALDQATRSAELREQYWETTVGSLRETQKKLQREVAEAKERIAALESDANSMEERLAQSTHAAAQLAEDKRALLQQLEATEAEARRNSIDRARFAAHLEQGLAMLGAEPPDPTTPRGADPRACAHVSRDPAQATRSARRSRACALLFRSA